MKGRGPGFEEPEVLGVRGMARMGGGGFLKDDVRSFGNPKDARDFGDVAELEARVLVGPFDRG